MTDLAIIILQKNEALHIRRCLEKLCPLEPRQVFVVDCLSTDGSDVTAKEMGATTEWTRAEAAQAEYYMAMAGWSPDKILAALPSVMYLASAGDQTTVELQSNYSRPTVELK